MKKKFIVGLAAGLLLFVFKVTAYASNDICPQSAYIMEDGAYMVTSDIDIPSVNFSNSTVSYLALLTKGTEQLVVVVGEVNGSQFWEGTIVDINRDEIFDFRSSIGDDAVITNCRLIIDTPTFRMVEVDGYYINSLSRLGNFNMRMTSNIIW